MTRAYRAEFFTAADYAVRSFEAETPEQALQLTRQFYDDNIIDLDFRSYDGCDTGLDEIQIWDTVHGTQARWESDDFRLRKAAPQLLAALQLILPRYADLLIGAGADLKGCEQFQTAKAAVAKAAPTAI